MAEGDRYVASEVPGSRRLRGVEFRLPLVVGTVAKFLGKQAEEFASHEWTVYVRGANNEDLSHIVKRAVFDLHSTFTPPSRSLDAAPYEVQERGWGEFDIGITVRSPLAS